MTEQLKGYVLDARLGAGGFAEVFAGRRVGTEGFARAVAIKRILPDYSEHKAVRAMFTAEARLTARLIHSNIVSVHDFDVDEEGRLFLVMELVDGTDLEGLMRTGPLPLPVILSITGDILRGLGYAHDLPVQEGDGVRGVIHRDVSPHNVLLAWDGAVKVTDFGIAKARSASQATASSMLKGKIAYMSPEQANSQALDGRSDLYSVGAMLWELLTNEPLVAGETFEAQLKSVLFEPVPLPSSRQPDIPPDVERVVMKLLEKDRDQRYRNASAAIADLEACASYPGKNARALLSDLLLARFPERAQSRTAGSATRVMPQGTAPGASADALTTVDYSIGTPVRPRPFPSPSVWRRRARRRVRLIVLATAIALGAGSAAYVRIRGGSEDAPSALPGAPATPSGSPNMGVESPMPAAPATSSRSGNQLPAPPAPAASSGSANQSQSPTPPGASPGSAIQSPMPAPAGTSSGSGNQSPMPEASAASSGTSNGLGVQRPKPASSPKRPPAHDSKPSSAPTGITSGRGVPVIDLGGR